MPHPNPRQCRVSLHADNTRVDLTLPMNVPIAELLPSIVDILATRDGGYRSGAATVWYRLSRPGADALDSSKTLAQHSITDGSVLLLTGELDEAPMPRFDDPVEQVCAAVATAVRPWTPRAVRSTANLTAVGLAATAGFVAVPGGPGAPNALLAAVAATAVAVLAMHLGEPGPALTALCFLAVLAVAAALTGVLSRVPLQAITAITAAAAVALLQLAGRLAMTIGGLGRLAHLPEQPRADANDRAVRAQVLLTGLVAACASAAALGSLGAAAAVQTAGTPRFSGVALTALIGTALLLRARAHIDSGQIAALVIGGIASLAGSLVAAGAAAPQQSLWLAATAAALAAVALYGGGGPALSPLAHRAMEVVEYPVLAAVLPVAGWVCGVYGAVRGLSLA